MDHALGCLNQNYAIRWMPISAGHAHHLEHDTIDECKMDHFVSGAGGAGLYGILDNHSAEFALSEHGFIELSVSEDRMSAAFYTIAGDRVYTTQRNK